MRVGVDEASRCRWRVWKDLAAYFPVRLHKTADLDPEGNYLFGYHPHGILCLSAWVAFATEACDVGAMCASRSPRSQRQALRPATAVCPPVFI